MSNNRRPPKELQRYVVVVVDKNRGLERETYQYFKTQREAKEWAKGRGGKKIQLFKINYDYYGPLS